MFLHCFNHQEKLVCDWWSRFFRGETRHGLSLSPSMHNSRHKYQSFPDAPCMEYLPTIYIWKHLSIYDTSIYIYMICKVLIYHIYIYGKGKHSIGHVELLLCFFFAFRRDASSINLDSPWAGRPDPLDEEAEPPHPLTLEVETTTHQNLGTKTKALWSVTVMKCTAIN